MSHGRRSQLTLPPSLPPSLPQVKREVERGIEALLEARDKDSFKDLGLRMAYEGVTRAKAPSFSAEALANVYDAVVRREGES